MNWASTIVSAIRTAKNRPIKPKLSAVDRFDREVHEAWAVASDSLAESIENGPNYNCYTSRTDVRLPYRYPEE